MVKYALLVILSTLFFVVSFSQKLPNTNTPKGIIKGFIYDSATKSTVADVTTTIESKKNGSLVNTTVTKEDGSFEISVPYDRYRLIITHIGYKSLIIDLPNFTSAIIYVGHISLAPIKVYLQDVVVVSEKKLIQQDINKISYNVEADPDRKTMSAFDIMRKVPMLSTDVDNKLQLNGSINFRVLINGRKSSLFVRNVSDVFKTMPAELIKKIEIMTNPPARYEAEGTAGIINIITVKKRINGYNGAVTLGADNPTGHTVGGYFTAKTGKLGLSLNLGNSANTTPPTETRFYRQDKLFHNILEQYGDNVSKSNSGYVNGEISFEIDSLNLLTANISTNTGDGESVFSQSVQLMNSAGVINQAYNNYNQGATAWSGADWGIDYQHSFKNKDELLTLSYKKSNNDNNGNTIINILPIQNYYRKESLNYNSNNFQEQTLQADYILPIKQHNLELGVKSIIRKNNSGYAYKDLDTLTGKFIEDPKLGNNFDYRQNINAGYASLSLRKENWGIIAGLRLEETKVNANFKTSNTAAAQKYFNLIPNIVVSRKISTMGNLTLSYSQRIERPSLYYLDPFIDVSDPKNIYYGNPNLVAAISNNFNLSYFTYVKGTSLTTAVYHHYTNNAIERYTSLGADTISRTTYGNIGSSRAYGFSLSSSTTLFKKLSLSINSSGNYIKYFSNSTDISSSNEGFSYDILGYLAYRLGSGWRTGASINYNSAEIALQGSRSGYISSNFSITKEFLKDKKASIGLTISNPFQKYRFFTNNLNDPSFQQLQESQLVVRRFNLTLSYRFGKLKEDIARKKRGIKNDDLKTEGDNAL